MNNHDQRRYERLTRVQTFGRERARSDFPAGGKAASLLAQVDQHLVDMEAAKASQAPKRMDTTHLRVALAEACRSITRTAKAIAVREPNFDVPYRVKNNPSEAQLLTHVDSVLTRLEDAADDDAAALAAKVALRARFTEYDMPADFVQTLRRQREAIRGAIQVNQGETQVGVENTALVEKLLDAAGDTVLELDALIANRFARDTEKLRAWRTASRVESAPKRMKKPADAVAGAGAVPATP